MWAVLCEPLPWPWGQVGIYGPTTTLLVAYPIQSRWLQFVSRKVSVGAVRWFPETVTDVGLGWLKNVMVY